MPVIRTESDRKADAMLEDTKQDWWKAYQIAQLKSKAERHEALEAAATDESGQIDAEYYEALKEKATTVFVNARKKAKQVADHASSNYQKVFKKGEQGSGAKRGITGTVRRKPKSDAAAHVASMLDDLSEGVTA